MDELHGVAQANSRSTFFPLKGRGWQSPGRARETSMCISAEGSGQQKDIGRGTTPEKSTPNCHGATG